MRPEASSKWSIQVVQIERPMSREAEHLSKSRHGIWHYRWVLPKHVRARHPHLPCELKKSTRTSDVRQARVVARRLHRAVALQIPELDMSFLDGEYPQI